MADTEPGFGATSPGAFMNGMEEGFRQSYASRLKSARDQVRKAQDALEAERICSQKATAEMTDRMAAYRRGRWYHVGGVVTSAVTGFTAGMLAQRAADVRIQGVPVIAVAGVPGIVAGAIVDESVVTRSMLAVGGTMFIVGAVTHVLTHPLPEPASGGPTP